MSDGRTPRERQLMDEAKPLTSEGIYFIDSWGDLWHIGPSPLQAPGDPVRIEIVQKGWARRSDTV